MKSSFEPPSFTRQTLLNFLNNKTHSFITNDCYYERSESTIFTSSYYVNFYLPQISGLEKEIANTLLNKQRLIFKPNYFTMNGKMSIPLRGTQCTHIDTVDIDRFIVDNYYRYENFWKYKNSSNWICPICKKKMPLNNIRISKWVQDKITYCEQNGIFDYFITYDLQNKRFNYFVIDQLAKQKSLDNYCSKIHILDSPENINSKLTSSPGKFGNLVFYETQSYMDISKMKISYISNEIAILNYFVSDNKSKFVINFDFPPSDLSSSIDNNNQYYGVIIVAFGAKRVQIFDSIKNENPFSNENCKQIKIFPCPLQPDFRYITFVRILYRMFPQMKFVFYYQCPYQEFVKTKKEILFVSRLDKEDVDIPLEEKSPKISISETMTKSISIAVNLPQKNKRLLNQKEVIESIKKYFQGDQNTQGSFLNYIYQFKNKKGDMNSITKIPSPIFSQNLDCFSTTFYGDLRSNSLIETIKASFYINIGFITIQKFNYETFYLTELSFSNSLISSLSFEHEEGIDNFEVPIIILSSRNFNYQSFAMLNPPNFEKNSTMLKDNQLTYFYFCILFFLCHAICIDFYGTNPTSEMELLDQFMNLKKEYPGLICKPLLIFCKDEQNFREIMTKLNIQEGNGIDSNLGNIQYFPAANAYIWPKDDNYNEEMHKDATIYNLMQRHGPFNGKQFIDKKAKKIAERIQFIFEEFSKYEITICPLNSSIDSYNFSLKAREYPD